MHCIYLHAQQCLQYVHPVAYTEKETPSFDKRRTFSFPPAQQIHKFCTMLNPRRNNFLSSTSRSVHKSALCLLTPDIEVKPCGLPCKLRRPTSSLAQCTSRRYHCASMLSRQKLLPYSTFHNRSIAISKLSLVAFPDSCTDYSVI